MENLHEKIALLEDYIMKKCLWQFHSRAWDRKDQNENILRKATQILCGDAVELETPADRCYWVDALSLTEAFQERYEWLAAMSKEEIKQLMQGLKERIDFVTITGSLNAELTDPRY
ncbi:MAG: Fe-only nitrogenase subunit delta [Chlorobiaceae bacterium]|nr:Fe-only nitrogenase subunit delta [Chlorobiaceae bacterium]NTW62672.1 Fe-only nitrogenase subunit delta [Chlorobiaceae bacterium]